MSYPPLLMKAKQAADYLGMSASKFQELVSAGRIAPPRECGGNVLWHRSDLEEFADSLPQRGSLVTLEPVKSL